MDDEMNAFFILFLDYFGWIYRSYVPLGNVFSIHQNFLLNGFAGAEECHGCTWSFQVIINKTPSIVITDCLVIVAYKNAVKVHEHNKANYNSIVFTFRG
jgi:hypothetical protein